MPHLEKLGSHVMIMNHRQISVSLMAFCSLTPAGTHTYFLTHLHTMAAIVFYARQTERQEHAEAGTPLDPQGHTV